MCQQVSRFTQEIKKMFSGFEYELKRGSDENEPRNEGKDIEINLIVGCYSAAKESELLQMFIV